MALPKPSNLAREVLRSGATTSQRLRESCADTEDDAPKRPHNTLLAAANGRLDKIGDSIAGIERALDVEMCRILGPLPEAESGQDADKPGSEAEWLRYHLSRVEYLLERLESTARRSVEI